MHITELETLNDWLQGRSVDPRTDTIASAVTLHLRAAHDAAVGSKRLTAARLDRATRNLDAAVTSLLDLAPGEYLKSQMPSLAALAKENLGFDDPRAVALEDLARRTSKEGKGLDLINNQRYQVVAAVTAAYSALHRRLARIRCYERVLHALTAGLVTAAISIAIVAAMYPSTVPLCLESRGGMICPTAKVPLRGALPEDVAAASASGGDYALVELVGLVAGAIAAAATLRNLRGTSAPYGLPVSLALLKLPAAALSAVLGVLIIRAQLLIGFPSLATSGQVLVWAALFGYLGQLILTRPVDQVSRALLAGGNPEASSIRVIQIALAWFHQLGAR